jgi:hypothetical protein
MSCPGPAYRPVRIGRVRPAGCAGPQMRSLPRRVDAQG